MMALAVFLPTARGWADENPYELPATLVRGGARHEAMPGSPVVSSVRPDVEIQAGQISDVTGLLKDAGSIFIQDSSYGKNVFLRNLGDQDYRILIDGVPVGQMGRYYTRSFSWEAVPTANIERIDVIRGAGSAEYGNTVVGTIDIVTKQGTGDLQGSGWWSLGSFTDLKGGATCSGSSSGADWFWGGGYRQRDPYLDNNDVHQWNVFSRVGYRVKDRGDFHVYGYTSHRNEGFVLDERVNWNVWSNARGLTSGSYFDLDNSGVQAVWDSDWVNAAFSYTAQDRDDHYKRDTWNTGDWWDYDLRYKAPSFKVKVHHRWRNHTWKLGGEYTYGDSDANWVYYEQGNEDVSFNQDLYGFFAEDSWQALPRVTLTFGVRFDRFENRISSEGAPGGRESRDELTGDGWSPRLSVAYQATDAVQIYGFFGRLFKAPAMADLYRWYGNYNLLSFGGRAVLRAFYGLDQPPGAPPELIPPELVADWQSMLGRLKPAKGYDAELGLKGRGDRFAYDLNLFYEYIDDYIMIYPISYPPTYNVDNVQLWGLEVSGIYTFSKWLEVEGNYAFVQNEKKGDEITEGIYETDDLFNAPEHVLNVFIRTRPFKGFMAEWQVNFVSGRFAGGAPGVPPQVSDVKPQFQPIMELGPYDIESIHLSYSPGPWRGVSPRFSFAVENLFDRQDYIRLDYPLPGRLFYGGIEVKI